MRAIERGTMSQLFYFRRSARPRSCVWDIAEDQVMPGEVERAGLLLAPAVKADVADLEVLV